MFIVIEGIDGAGCETQGKNLLKMFTNNRTDRSRPVPTLIKYPDYERNVGKLIKDFLYQNKNLSAEQQFLLYSLQFLMDKEMIAEKRKDGILIADRYFTTTLCYQTLEGIKLEKALNFAEDFAIEKPDLVFYVKVDPDIAIQRKHGEDKEKNFREKDFNFIRKTYIQYENLVKNQVWTKWVEIDGNKSIDEVTKEIYNKIKQLNG
jgi:dTMP kinase